MQAVESVEHGQRGLQGVAIIKGTYISIAIGRRVDGSPEVILGTDVGIYDRQESSCGTRLAGLIIVQL